MLLLSGINGDIRAGRTTLGGVDDHKKLIYIKLGKRSNLWWLTLDKSNRVNESSYRSPLFNLVFYNVISFILIFP